MTSFRRLTTAELQAVRTRIDAVCEGMRGYLGPNTHKELGRRLLAALGDIDIEYWPALFGGGGIKGASYLGTAYSGARLERALAREAAASTARGERLSDEPPAQAGGSLGNPDPALRKAS